ncbi:UrcA family protein [Erythrobacter sp. MTPC3]|uniref:UrcA family protein n=1 Tax=Erythrobacter sp. MTPC3 TaxID=3056564 RepID=UPI0036F1DA2B
MKTLTLAIALTLGMALGLTAFPAAADTGANTVAVPYHDLNLGHAEGRATLDRRIMGAVRKVCNVRWTRSARAATQARECMRETMAQIAPLRARLIAQADAKTVSAELAHKST